MKWNDVLRNLKRHDNRETLVDIVDEYSTQEGRRKNDLIDFIEKSSEKKFNHMVDTLEKALYDKIKRKNKQRKIYLVDLGLSYDRNNFEYRIEQKYVSDNNDDDQEVDSYDPFYDGGGRRRRKRGGTVGYGERCGTNEDCDEGLKCELERLLSGPQVDNNQRGTCKGGRRRRRKRTRRKKKSKRRKRKRKRTKKKRRRRRRK